MRSPAYAVGSAGAGAGASTNTGAAVRPVARRNAGDRYECGKHDAAFFRGPPYGRFTVSCRKLNKVAISCHKLP